MVRSNALLLLCLLPSICQGQTLTWDGLAGNGFWGANNWIEGDYLDMRDLVFGNQDQSSTNLTTSLFGDGMTNASERVPQSIEVTRTTGSVVISPGSGNDAHLLRIQSGGITVANSGSRLVVETNTRLRAGQTWAVQQGTGELIVRDGSGAAKALDLNGNELTINGPGNTTIRTNIVDCDPSNPGCGVGSLVKRGAGTLLLTGNNSFTGGMAIHNGVVNFGTTTAGFGGDIVVNDSVLEFSSSPTLTNDFTLNDFVPNDDGPVLSVNGGQTVDLRGSISGQQWKKTGSGTLILNGGDLSNAGDASVMEGTLSLSNPDSLSSSIEVSSGASLLFGHTPDRIFSGGISGAGSVQKSGVGRLTLNGPVSYSGPTSVLQGTFSLSNPDSLTSDIDVSAGASLLFGHTPDRIFSGGISGAGSVQKSGVGRLTLNGPVSYSGPTSVLQGTFSLSNPDSLTSDIDVSAGASLLFGHTPDRIFSGGISGAGSVQKSGVGRLTLNGPVSYSGPTSVLQGTFSLSNPDSLTSDIDVSAGASLLFGHTPDRIFSGGISGAGSVQKSGVGRLTLNGPVSYSGPTSVLQGTFSLSNPDSLTSDIDVSAGASLLFGHTPDRIFSGGISGAGSVQKSGVGRLTLNGPVSYSGPTSVLQGTFSLSNPDSLTSDIDVSAGASLLFGHTPDRIFSGGISGAGSVQKSGVGRLTLNGPVSYSGPTSVLQGTFSLSNPDSLTSDIDVSAGAFLLFGHTPDRIFTGVISGAGAVQKAGGGTLTISSGNTYTGGTSIQSGTIVAGASMSLGTGDVDVASGATLRGNPIVQGDLTNAGRLAPGNSPGIVTVGGNLTLTGSSVLEIEVGAPTDTVLRIYTPGVSHDQVQVTGVADLGGTFQFPTLPGFDPQLGDELVFLTAQGGVNGAPDAIDAPVLGSGLAAQVVKTSSDVRLLFVQPGNLQFIDTDIASNWEELTSWSDNRVPDSTDDVLVDNQSGGSQLLDVVDAIANPYALTVATPLANAPITINVRNNQALHAATGDIDIGQNASIRLGTESGEVGNLLTTENQSVRVHSGGILAGNGQIGDISAQRFVVIEDGRIEVGATDTLSIHEQVTLSTDSIVQIELGAASHGLLEIDTNSDIGGTLRVILADGYTPNAGDSFKIVGLTDPMDMPPPIIDEFEMEDLPILPPGSGLTINYGPAFDPRGIYVYVATVIDFDGDGNVATVNDLDSLVAAIAAGSGDLMFDMNGDARLDKADLALYLDLGGILEGDTNLDGAVDGADFLVWNASKFTATAAWSQGDFNADGNTDGADFVIWNANKFQSSMPLAIPEPGTFYLAALICGSACLLRQRRSRSRLQARCQPTRQARAT